ncbi:MAG: MBL fold metallo-hydrolase [Burkholderiales bacterium]
MNSQKILNFDQVTGICLGHAYIGQPYMSVFCYLVDGLLIDTSASNNRRALINVLQGRQIEHVALTHYHEDHAGNAAYLHQTFGLEVFGHAYTSEKLSKPVHLKPYERILFGTLESLTISPLPKILETPKFKFSHVHTPGHSADHVVFLEKDQGWIFSGDMFLGPRVKYFRSDECLYSTICSLQKIVELDFDKLFCGHNPQMKNAKAMIIKKRDHLMEVYLQSAELVQQGASKAEVVQRLTNGKEQHWVKLFTLGDVSYKNMVLSAIASIERGESLGHGFN